MPEEFIRGGTPRDFDIEGDTFHPAEGEKIVYKLSGRGGPAHLAGDGDLYGESNPQLGGWTQTFSCDSGAFDNLRTHQSKSEKVTGFFTMPSGTTYSFFGKISNDDALELDDGTVSVEFMGNVEKQG